MEDDYSVKSPRSTILMNKGMEAKFMGRKMSMPAVDKNDPLSPVKQAKGSVRDLKLEMKKLVPMQRDKQVSQVVKERIG